METQCWVVNGHCQVCVGHLQESWQIEAAWSSLMQFQAIARVPRLLILLPSRRLTSSARCQTTAMSSQQSKPLQKMHVVSIPAWVVLCAHACLLPVLLCVAATPPCNRQCTAPLWEVACDFGEVLAASAMMQHQHRSKTQLV